MIPCVERYGFLPVDKAAFKGGIPEIENMVPFEPFDFYVKRKLYIHNMGHATCAYLGNYLGLTYIYESIDNASVRLIVHNAMLESAIALSRKYGIEMHTILNHIDDLLYRFTNDVLGDTCDRVGADPERKLSPTDRLIGASLETLEQGFHPIYISVGTAAAVYRYIDEHSEYTQTVEDASQVLSNVSGLSDDNPIADLVLKFYGLLLNKTSIEDILRYADKMNRKLIGDVV